MVKYEEAVKWFIHKNPGLANGCIDENICINKLLYFASLLYFAVYNEKLLDRDFVAFPKGPVIYDVYRDYRYNGLNAFQESSVEIDSEIEKIFNIINLVYGNRTAEELVEESHTHALWKNVSHLIPENPIIDISKADIKLTDYYRNIFKTYENIDFKDLKKEKINGNIYYYYQSNLTLDENIVEELMKIEGNAGEQFIENIDGELVFS